MVYDVLVIGGGINGLCTAWQLMRRGIKKVAVVEQFAFGHDRGSSHGTTRITRSSYADRRWVKQVQQAHREEWPALEAAAGEPLLTPRDGCFFGPWDGPFRAYTEAVSAEGADVVLLDPAEAHRRFPMFHFPKDEGVLWDRTAAVVAASRTMAALLRVLGAGGVTLLPHTPVRRLSPGSAPLRVETAAGPLHARAVVVTAGPWISHLVPELSPVLSVYQQTVAYYDWAGDADAFPVWAWFGTGISDFFYGLPGRPGLKAAEHRRAGPPESPDATWFPDTASVDAFVGARVRPAVGGHLRVERCLYTVTDDERFVLQPHREDARILIGAACSGHAFKLGPVTGRALAEAAIDTL